MKFIDSLSKAARRLGVRKILLIGIGVALAVALIRYVPIESVLSRLVEWIDGLGPWSYAAMIVAYIAACLLLIPGWMLTLSSGAIFGVLIGTAVVSAGSTLGAAAAFLVGRHLARKPVERRIADNPKFEALDKAAGNRGFQIVLLTRLSPIFPFNLLNYALGLTKVSFRSYFFASWIGMLPGTVLYVYVGSTARDLAQIVSGDLEPARGQTFLTVIGLAATITVTVYVTHIARAALREALPETAESSHSADTEELK